MSGLTSKQQWTHDHITRCTCGTWHVITHRQLTGHTPTTCHHTNPAAMERTT